MRYQINLLSKKHESLVDRVIYFSLNYLRYVLVITQTVVIGVFFYKFKADQEIIDYQEAVEQKQEIVTVSEPLVMEGKMTDFKISQVKTILAKQDKTVSNLDYLLSVFPQQIYLQKLNIDEKGVIMDGSIQDVSTMKSFLRKLKKDARFKQIELKGLKKTEHGYDFGLTLGQLNIK